MEKVEAYKSLDGRVYESAENASCADVAHITNDIETRLGTMVNEWARDRNAFLSRDYRSDHIENVVDFLVENNTTVHELIEEAWAQIPEEARP